MLRLLAEPAFVLHRRQYSESSLLLEVLTREHGRLGLLARGARGARSALPALLQPFQELRIDAAGSGELLRLNRAEPHQEPVSLPGERALAGLYCNELLVRLWPRADAQPELFERYRALLLGIARPQSLAWELRRFERDLLDMLGYGSDYAHDADGEPLVPDGRYQYTAEHGFVGVAEQVAGYSGRALLALAADDQPEPDALRELRRLLRALIGAQLQGPPLHSWGMLAELTNR